MPDRTGQAINFMVGVENLASKELFKISSDWDNMTKSLERNARFVSRSTPSISDSLNKSMKKVKVKEQEFELEDKDTALILAIQELTGQIRRLANNGR